MSGIKDQDGLPLSQAEYERRKTKALTERGAFVDIRDDAAELSLSPEAHAIIAKDAARLGIDVETYLQKVWREQLNRVMAKDGNRR